MTNHSFGNRLALFLLLFIFILTGTALAQQAPIDSAWTKPKRLSIKARPLPECKSFLLTEFGFSLRLASHSSFSDDPAYVTGDFGAMVNKNERSARGATIFIAVSDDVFRFGLKPRYRRWWGRNSSLDISPGLIFFTHDINEGSPLKTKFPGFAGHIGLHLSHWFAFTANMEIIAYETQVYVPSLRDKKGTDISFFGGAKLGSTPGLILGSIGILLAVAYGDQGFGFRD